MSVEDDLELCAEKDRDSPAFAIVWGKASRDLHSIGERTREIRSNLRGTNHVFLDSHVYPLCKVN